MCDTLVALGNATKDGSVIFGKNSDRPRTEVQLITHSPQKKHSNGEELKCTYITIPQVLETAEIVLSQPWWMWGAEMGVNEYDVVIGNEAVYTHEPLRNIGLLGMDLLRLGLERGKNARDAMIVITRLLEEFGQGGGCDYNNPNWSYQNSFLIADHKEAYVLETADKWWIAEKVKDVRSISNSITIRGKGDMRRKGIIDHAIEKGYCKDDEDFDFAFTFSGSPVSDQPSPRSRGGKSTIMLRENKGEITPKLMMDFLREHDAGICMHGSFESTGSQVSHLKESNKAIHWFTGSTLPCLSIYKPYIFPLSGQKVLKSGPYSKIDSEWFWSRHSGFIKQYRRSSSSENKIKYQRSLQEVENEIILKIDDISPDNIKDKVKEINLEAWQKAEKMIT